MTPFVWKGDSTPKPDGPPGRGNGAENGDELEDGTSLANPFKTRSFSRS